jgi:putative tricarboxylic transport membrane protein
MFDPTIMWNSLMEIITPLNILALIFGSLIGFVIGLLPGATATMGVALMVPLTFVFPTTGALLALLGVYVTAVWAGSICAILINVPGTPASAATTFDGFPLSKKGEAARALAASSYSSTFGTLFSGVVLVFVAPIIAQIALKFGPLETCALALFGLSLISSLSSDSPLKGWLIALAGLLIATVGMDPQNGTPRFTFHIVDLLSGISVVPVLIGIFSVPEAIALISTNTKFEVPKRIIGSPFLSLADFRRILPTTVRSSIIGSILGITPAVGPETSTFLGYTTAKRFSRYRHLLGKGEIDGVAASEAASCAVLGAALIPLLTLGLPGSAEAAAFMGGLLIHGVRPGPLLFTEQASTLWILLWGFFAATVVMFILSIISTVISPTILRLPRTILSLLIIVLSIVGSFATNNNIFDVYVMLIAGILAYALRLVGFSCVPFILAVILGPVIETHLAEALAITGGWDKTGELLLHRPIALVFFIIALLSFVLPIFMKRKTTEVDPV